jgi:hypothetical protein
MKSIGAVIRRVLVVLSTSILALSGVTAFAQTNLPPTWVFARAYNGWNIVSQQADTYTFNGGVCNFTPSTNGNVPSIFVFSGYQAGVKVYYPVAITDSGVGSTTSEIVTPTATNQSASSCGFSASTLHSHATFVLSSGTAGLQEAIVTQQQNAPDFDVILDKYWYQTVAALPGNPTPASIIASVTGNANVAIVDTTTQPWTFYSWTGTQYVAVAPTGSLAITSVTPLAAPAALSSSATTNGIITTSSTGGTIPISGSTYRLAATYVTAIGGETTISSDSASTITTGTSTATNSITVTSPAAATGAVGWRIYVSPAAGAAGSEILYTTSCISASTGQTVLNGVCAIGSSAVVTAITTGTATVPTVNSAFLTAGGTTSPLQDVLSSYPPFTAVATISAAATGTLGTINLPAGYLNSLGRTIRICGSGFATTNSTPGTLTLATTLASTPGVTTITPFTAVSGATTASAAVNFNFCTDWTTTATGATGTLEAHGWANYTLAGTAVASPAADIIRAASASVNLTTQDQIAVTLTPATTAITTGGAQLRQLTVEVLQ